MSEVLLAQAFEIIFKELERYLKMMSKFKGVDWSVYVQMRNQERKKGDAPKKLENPDDLLLDEIEVEEEKEEKKEEVKEEVKEEAKKEEDQQIPSSSTPATVPDNACPICTFINEPDAFECEMCGSELVPPSMSAAGPVEKKADGKEDDGEASDHGNEEE